MFSFGTGFPGPALASTWRRLIGLLQQVSKFAGPLFLASFLALGWLRRKYDQIDKSCDPEKGEGRDEAKNVRRGSTEPPSKRPRVEDDEEEDFASEECTVRTSDEFYCDHDSTWEAEEDQQATRRPSRSYKFSRFQNAARDMQNYRHGYKYGRRRESSASQDDMLNLNFYLGKQPSLPDNVYINDFHKHWFGDYDSLESVHSFIQWLFPLEEQGMNHMARTLTKAEIQEFLQSQPAKENLLKSYKLMLDFYGIELCNEETGEVKRANNWRARFKNMNSRTHNNLRLTRILKCLGTLGYRHYQAPLVHFFLEETLINEELENVKESVLNYFVFAVLDKEERRKLVRFAFKNYKGKDEFVWCPKKIQIMWSRMDGKQNSNSCVVDLNDED